ncbi:hypothetical protein BS50DRAFT_577390 [Corynespora cassiicola Philippines]|uniref:Membrane-associated proteins in eicosanoid and glutathione metabolism n=1 Tax=Corynespora cassiicola Philippines TaxID=1448308 RepID=A0A2T2NAN0_CORCC|nr:hypothetical protein BS50DRAFT_577390 [Corynespora cassiicola Philippines]
MATHLGLGPSLPFAPATGTWAAPFAVYWIFLQSRITYLRVSSGTVLGDRIDASKGEKDPLYLANRSLVNFSENVPLALSLGLLAELNGGSRKWIGYGLGALFALRISHAEFGLMRGGLGVGRILGFYGTQIVMLGLGVYGGLLVKENGGF